MIQSSIPSDIDEIYMALFQEVSHLHRKWGVFRHLYVSGQEIVDLINDAGHDFFGITQTLLAHDIVLTIARLTDPKQSAGRDNLCLEQLINFIDVSQHGQLRQNIERIYSVSKPKFSFAKIYRNKLIAHNDFATKLARVPEPPIPTTTDIEDGLKGIRDVMNAVPQYFVGLDIATVNYYDLVTRPGGENRLIARLHAAKEMDTRHDDSSIGGEA
jgi:hypothetical protein